jgi:hypothetical protein
VTAAQEYWWLAPSISALALAAILWFNFGQQKVRQWRLKRPFNACLCHGPEQADEFWVLHVPPHSEVMVQVRIRPRIAYRQLEIVFGFYGDRSKRPFPKRALNTFINEGMNREPSPATNPNYYIDQDDHYHITTPAERTPPHTYVMGFIVQTNEPGRYPVLLGVFTDCGEANPDNDLYVVVEELPSSGMEEKRC